MRREISSRMFAVVLAAAVSLVALGGCQSASHRPEWAQSLECSGVPNFYRVDEHVYRGGQPTAEGIRELKALGVKTIIDLRGSNTDLSLLSDTGLVVEWIPMDAMAPSDQANAEVLRVLSDKSRGPFFVHCWRGSDRTGEAIALYRIANGWSRDAAVEEMRNGGFGFFPLYINLVEYVRSADVHDLMTTSSAPGDSTHRAVLPCQHGQGPEGGAARVTLISK